MAFWSSNRAFTGAVPRRHDRSELSRRDAGRVRAERLDRRIQPNPAESARIDEQQRATVGEGQREPARTGSHPAPARAPSSHRRRSRCRRTSAMTILPDMPRWIPSVGPGARERPTPRGLAPHALAPPVGNGQSSADQRRPDLARPVRTAHVSVGVVHVDDSATQRRSLDDGARGLDLGQLGHRHDLAWCWVTGGSGSRVRAECASTAPRLRLSARVAELRAAHDAARGVQCLARASRDSR